jgi:D-amino-acid dehydrogenase
VNIQQQDSHTVVVGAGVIGVATAYYLAQRGRKVTVLDQNDICSGCSRGNAGQITPGHLPLTQPGTLLRNLAWMCKPTSPLFIAPRFDMELFRWLWRFHRSCNHAHLRKATEMLCRLGSASSLLFAQLAEELDLGCHSQEHYQNQGRLEICRTETSLRAVCQEAELLQTCGFEATPLRGKEVTDFEPTISDEVAGAIYFPNSGSCDPYQFILKLANAAEALGAKFCPHTHVQDLHVRNGRVTSLVTQDGEIVTDSVVLACGSWTPHLARRLGLQLPIQPGKGYHLDITRPVQSPKIPVVLVEERVFVTPLGNGLRLAGTMELSGFNLLQRPARLDMLAQAAGRYFPDTGKAQIHSRWCHLRPMTPDGLPVIGKTQRIENAWVAAGHGMLGLTQGPITGQLLADWIVDGQPQLDLTQLSPDRF